MSSHPNDNVNALTAFTAPVAPSVTLKVILKEPASASVVDGVMVNTLSACDTVAVLPKEPVVTAYDHVKGNPSGSVDTAVIVVAVPSVASVYVPSTPVIAVGLSFVIVATRYHAVPVYMKTLFNAVTNAWSPALIPVAAINAAISE